MSLTRPLTPVEIRVLGALMEKEQTTPDAYPLTIKGVLTACNQKSNREPVTELSETAVVEALDALRQDVLTWRQEGARVERWEHCLDRRWHLDRGKKAVMTLLMLRGPQTPGEMRTRSDRLHPFASVGEVEAVLAELAAGGAEALVRELPRRPGQRENRWTHLVGTEEPVAPIGVPAPQTPMPAAPAASGPAGAGAPPAPPAPGRPPAALDDRLKHLEQTVRELAAELRALRIRLGDLEEEEQEQEET